MLSMYLFENKFPAYTNTENAYCKPYKDTNWRSLEEAFGGCSSTSSCAAFWLGSTGTYQYCTSIDTTVFSSWITLYTKTGKNFLQRHHFVDLTFFINIFFVCILWKAYVLFQKTNFTLPILRDTAIVQQTHANVLPQQNNVQDRRLVPKTDHAKVKISHDIKSYPDN